MRGAARGSPGPPPSVPSAGSLPDELVRAVRLDLEDVELRVQRVVGLRRPAELTTEDPVLDPHLLHLAEDVALALDRPLADDAGPLDGLQHHLRGAVARRAERA